MLVVLLILQYSVSYDDDGGGRGARYVHRYAG